jgi:thiol-disulfide isomerase/thioredoxin
MTFTRSGTAHRRPRLTAASIVIGGMLAAGVSLAAEPDGPTTTTEAPNRGSKRLRLPAPPAGATVDELFAYIETIADPAIEPDSKGRLRFHRRKVAALTAAAADAILAQLPDDDPRHARAVKLKGDAEAAARPPAAAGDAGAERRLALRGQPIELAGALLDGTPFDQASLAGKVVLVDFWATWCGPCVAEIPRVRELYDRYHDRGFDVVGISLDEDADDVAAFVGKHEIPWPIIHDRRGDDGRPPLAERYGITAIPTMILVGRDGLVVSIEARGRRLEELLAEAFPDE